MALWSIWIIAWSVMLAPQWSLALQEPLLTVLPANEKTSELLVQRPVFMSWLLQGPFRQDFLERLQDSTSLQLTEQCAVESLRKTLQALDLSAQKTHLQKWLFNCEAFVRRKPLPAWLEMLTMLRLNRDYLSLQNFKKYTLRALDGQKIRALLGVQPRAGRPLVIIRPGIFSNVEEAMAESYLIDLLYFIGKANVLVVSSSSGSGDQQDNLRFAPGGVTESLQNLALAESLKRKEIFKDLEWSSLHLLGISMGGHGVLHALAHESFLHERSFQSAVALCPVFDLKSTLSANAMDRSLMGIFKSFWASLRLKFFETHVEKKSSGSSSLESAQLWAEKNVTLSKKLSSAIGISADLTQSQVQADLAWQQTKKFKTPLFILTTKNDQLVPPNLNIDRYFAELQQKAQTVETLSLEAGEHCSLAASYREDFVAALLLGLLRIE